MILITKNIPNWYGSLMYGTVHITVVLISEYPHMWNIAIETHLHCSPQYLFHSKLTMKCLIDPVSWSELNSAMLFLCIYLMSTFIICEMAIATLFFSPKFSKVILHFTKVCLILLSQTKLKDFFRFP